LDDASIAGHTPRSENQLIGSGSWPLYSLHARDPAGATAGKERDVTQRGSMPCLDLIDLDTYIGALAGLDVTVIRDAADA